MKFDIVIFSVKKYPFKKTVLYFIFPGRNILNLGWNILNLISSQVVILPFKNQERNNHFPSNLMMGYVSNYLEGNIFGEPPSIIVAVFFFDRDYCPYNSFWQFLLKLYHETTGCHCRFMECYPVMFKPGYK